MSDSVWLAIIGLIGLVVKDYLDRMRADRMKELADIESKARAEAEKAAAEEVKAVKDTLRVTTAKAEESQNGMAQDLGDLKKVSKATHTLVNSQFAIQLKKNASSDRGIVTVLQRMADMATDPVAKAKILEEVKLAEITALESERAVADHAVKQEVVDDQPGTDAQKSGRSGPRAGSSPRPDPPTGRLEITIGQAVGDMGEQVDDIHKVVVPPPGDEKKEEKEGKGRERKGKTDAP